MVRTRVEAGANVWESDDGSLRIEIPLPHLVRVTFRGHLTDDFVEPISVASERLTHGGRPVIGFQDWEGMTNYEMSARMRLVAVALRDRAKTGRIHFVVGSTMIRIGIEVANLVVGKFEVHAGRRSFEEAYARALADNSASPRAARPSFDAEASRRKPR